MWYREWFRDANYSVVYDHRDEDEAEYLLDLIERITGSDKTRRTLDLACGSGRHAISLARRGYQDVTGVDLSPTLLDEGNAEATRTGVSVNFLEQDMRELRLEGLFDLVLNVFTSFGYFELDEENAMVIQSVASLLSTEGTFVLDFFNADWVRTHIVAHDERILPDGKRLEQTRWIENGRVEKRMLIRGNERGGSVAEAQEFLESVRLFTLTDFERMFADAGLRIRSIAGSYAGAAFDAERSPRLIMFVTR
jgi:SAM-dependent methyltransferase